MAIIVESFPGSVKFQTILPDGRVSSETTSKVSDSLYFRQDKTKGSSPKEPDGWRKPSYYLLNRTNARRPHGVTEYHYAGQAALSRIAGDNPYESCQITLPVMDNGLRQKAEVDALTKLKDQQVNLAQAFAERDQTARLVGDTAARIARAYRAVRKGNFKKAASELGRRPRKQTQNWLEWQYAWKPLLSDVHGAVEELKGSDPAKWLVTVKGAKQNRWRVVENGSTTARPPVERRYEHFQGAFVRLDYYPSNEFLSTLTGLGLTNPLNLAWELLPYSFIVDWFLPIGDWLNVLDATAGFNFRSGSVSILQKSSVRVVPLPSMPSPSILVRNDVREGRGTRVRLERIPYTSSPLPRPPGLKNPVSLVHMANGLSLLAEAFGRRR